MDFPPSSARAPASRGSVPRYGLYGELARRAAPGFVHMETLSSRSALHGWEIAPHCHEGVQQVFWIGSGGGVARLDQARHDFAGPALIVVPAPLVHAFVWQTGSEGHVLTLAGDYVASLKPGCEAHVAGSLDTPLLLAFAADGSAGRELAGQFDRLAAELRFASLGMATAVAAQVQMLMVAIARLAPPEPASVPGGAEMWQRFRDALERGFRTQHGVAEIAAGLPITRGRLDALCRRHAGRSAQQIIHDRLLLEAQRSLLYTGLTLAEIAYDLGFADPAYFTRFFTREAGEPPGVFRKRHRQ